MKTIHNIRALYMPVQPCVKEPAGDVLYHEFLPDIRLREFIYCYWQLKTENPLTAPYHYRVVADGCMDIFFELADPAHAFVMGFNDAYSEFPLAASFNYVGIRFLPGMFPLLYKVNAAELAHHAANFDEVAPAGYRFLKEGLPGHAAVSEIKSMLDAHFLGLLPKTIITADSRLYESIDTILRTAGNVRIEKELPQGISARQLRRLFEFYIGDTPKAFSKVVRFQQLLRSPGDILKSRAYLEAGYYDQAHFIREFKRLYGLTPSKVS
ncbi:AraC family transcriptional regulator [Chitinophaga sp. 22321]|uniref:AraC family transcriptional regulator n=1 Tax=Chitinophaga hostae TaxID=2831022 RepID=A0ABS5IWI5_9BACT|nr:helix-turn-helix domain-containing protein [Chitinophaga hostae]MBS0027286.1 AraC family transcriptional regulator [Chitinophaga hostae]